jgi:hypothetical protein
VLLSGKYTNIQTKYIKAELSYNIVSLAEQNSTIMQKELEFYMASRWDKAACILVHCRFEYL